MTHVLIADDIYMRPQMVRLTCQPRGPAALGLWVLALSWMHAQKPIASDIPSCMLRSFGGTASTAELLVNAGLWIESEDAYIPVSEDSSGRKLWKSGFKPSRPAIPCDIRDAVFARDGHRCVECGSVERLSLDHIYPWSRGGPDTIENLRVLCRSCNSSKGARI